MAQITRLTDLKGVGPKLSEQLAKLNIHSLTDVLFHLPFRYEDRSRVIPIAGLQPMQPAVIQGKVRSASVVIKRNKRSLAVKLQDHTGVISLRFYHFSNAQKNQFQAGAICVVTGSHVVE